MSELLYIMLYLTGFNILKHYKLHKDFNKNDITILNPKEFKTKFTKKDINRIKTLKIGKDILKFKNTLEQNINNNYLNNMYNNFKTIKAKKDLFILLLLGMGGFYVPKRNSITLNEIVKDEVIDHELLHASSSYYDEEKKLAYIGFAQINYNNNKNIGKSLNEGYTSLLVNRYFPRGDIELSDSYKICRLFAAQIEKIIGQEKMEEAYFKADLNMLINELEKYDRRENIISVINSLDFILLHLKDKKNLLLNCVSKRYAKNCLIISLDNIQCHLIKWYTKKLQKDLDNNLITNSEFEYEIMGYTGKIYENEILEKIPKKKIKTN